MANQLDQIVEKLRKALDTRLVSVVLYGSAATGDHQEKFSDYNILCILTRITPAELRAVEPAFRWWREQGNPSPLLLTEHELKTSTDCFAIEFHDIREHHRIRCGCVRRPAGCFQTKTRCANCLPIRFPRSAFCSAMRCCSMAWPRRCASARSSKPQGGIFRWKQRRC